MASTHLQKMRLFSRDVRLMLLAYATAGFCYFGIMSVLRNVYLLRLGYGPQFIGLFNGAAWVTFTVSSLPAGALGKRWGSRRTMIAGISLIVLGYGLLPLVEMMPSALWDGWLLVTNSLAYLGGALWAVNGIPFLVGATSDEERDLVFSTQAALIPLATFVGNLVGGFLPGLLAPALRVSLDASAPYRYPMLIAALGYGVVALPAVVATRDVSTPQTRATRTEAGRAPHGLIAIMALTRMLWASGGWAVGVFFNVYMDASLHAPISLIGTIAAVGGLVAVPAALSTPMLMNHLGKDRTIVWASLGVALSLLPLAILPHWVPAGLGLAAASAAGSIATTAFNIYSQEIVPSGWRAVMSGAGLLAWGLSSSVVSFTGGRIIAARGYASLFLIGSGVTALGALLFWTYFRRARGETSWRWPIRMTRDRT